MLSNHGRRKFPALLVAPDSKLQSTAIPDFTEGGKEPMTDLVQQIYGDLNRYKGIDAKLPE